MYAGPIVKTYTSLYTYQQDAAVMMSYGYQAINVEQFTMTDGLILTLILIFGLLLTPFCIGVVILCFLPMAFSKRWNVTYIPYSQISGRASPYGQPYAQPQPQLLPQPQPPQVLPQPHHPHRPNQSYSQPLAPQPAVRTNASHHSASPAYLTANPQQHVPFMVRMRDHFETVQQVWNTWKLWQQVLVAAGAALVVGIAIVDVIVIAIFVLPH